MVVVIRAISAEITRSCDVSRSYSAYVNMSPNYWVLGNDKASQQVSNISGDKYVTFDGLAKACAKAAGCPEPEIVHYNPKEFEPGLENHMKDEN